MPKHPSDRFHQAQRNGYGAQQSMTIEYQIIGEEMKGGTFDVYMPVAKGCGNKKIDADALRVDANRVLREVFCAVAELLKAADGMMRFSYSFGDEEID